MNALSYALTYFAARAAKRGGQLLDLLDEDRLFGVNSFEIDGRHVSRDLLDSIAELRFLERHLGGCLADAVLLDIGAGYGRLAYRTVTAWPSIGRYLCTDAIAESTFLSEYYLRYRGVDHKTTVVPLDEIDRELAKSSPQIAINIHSFSECSLEAINWWCTLLAKHRVPLVMIVPNSVGSDGMSPLTNNGTNFAPVLEAHGYRLRAAEAKYLDSVVQNYGINPAVHLLYGRGGL
jgi:putative sugar O-methyltransferase